MELEKIDIKVHIKVSSEIFLVKNNFLEINLLQVEVGDSVVYLKN